VTGAVLNVDKMLLESGGYLLLESGGKILLGTETTLALNSGVFGAGSVGQVAIAGWTTIDDAQNPNWVNINDAQAPVWVDVDTST
jgi:hypothetical protein